MRKIEEIEQDLDLCEDHLNESKDDVEYYEGRVEELKNELKEAKENNKLKGEHGDVFVYNGKTFLVVEQDGELRCTGANASGLFLNSMETFVTYYDDGTWDFQYNVFNPDKKKRC